MRHPHPGRAPTPSPSWCALMIRGSTRLHNTPHDAAASPTVPTCSSSWQRCPAPANSYPFMETTPAQACPHGSTNLLLWPNITTPWHKQQAISLGRALSSITAPQCPQYPAAKPSQDNPIPSAGERECLRAFPGVRGSPIAASIPSAASASAGGHP